MIHIDISLESDSNWNKRLLNSISQYCLIFEDDVKFINSSKNNSIFINKLPNLINNWDILYLGYLDIESKQINNNPIFIYLSEFNAKMTEITEKGLL